MRREVVLMLLASVFGVGLFGCGGGSGSDETGATDASSANASKSKQSYVLAGNKICAGAASADAKLFADRARLTKELASSPSVAESKQMEGVLKQIASARDEMTTALAGLDAPASVDTYLAARKTTSERIRTSAAAFGAYAEHPTDAAVSSVVKAQTAEVAATAREVKLAREAGLKACGARVPSSG